MRHFKRKKRLRKEDKRFNLYRCIGLIFISISLMALLNLVKIFSEKIFPILGGLTLAEANAECDLMKIEKRWDHEDGFKDCMSHYTSDQLVAAELLYNVSSISLSSMLFIIFTLGGIVMLSFLQQ